MKAVERIKMGSRGHGSLIKTKDSKNWLSAYYVCGKEHVESTGTSVEKDARRIHKATLDRIAASRQGHALVLTPTQKRVTINELLDGLHADHLLRRCKSTSKMASDMTTLRTMFGTTRACDVTPELVDRYIQARLAAGKRNATINRALQLLGAAYTLAVRRRTLTSAPHIRKLSEAGNARRGFFEQHDFEQVLAHLPEHLQDAATFASITGWRRGEVVALRWDWVDLAAGTITLPDSKNGRGRVLAVAGELVELMKRREAARLTETPAGDVRVADFVFHRRGRPLGDFKTAWHTALTRAGLSEQVKQPDGTVRRVYTRKFHDFRRTAARNMVRAGVREGVAMAVTGHRTRSVFDRYNISSTDDVRDALEAVSRPVTKEPQ